MSNIAVKNFHFPLLQNLGRNCLTSVGCKYICAMLRVNSNLAILDLSSNEFGDNVGRYLSNALKVRNS